MMMFLYDWIPNFIFQIIFAFGLIGTPLTWLIPTLPFVGQYQAVLRIVSIACLTIGLVWYGINASEARWAARVATADAKIAQLEKDSGKVTEKIVVEYVDRVKVIKEKGENLVIRVPYYVSKEADNKCPVPAGFVRLYNRAADSGLPDTTGGANAASGKAEKASGTASGTK
jgi:hypothetical protein